jgi:hypothetical protein
MLTTTQSDLPDLSPKPVIWRKRFGIKEFDPYDCFLEQYPEPQKNRKREREVVECFYGNAEGRGGPYTVRRIKRIRRSL